MVFPFLTYLFSKGNMQPGLKIFLQIGPAPVGLFWGAEGLITSVFILHLPLIAMRCCVVLVFDEGVLLGLLTSNSYFLLTFLFFTCFPLPQNPLHSHCL